MRAGRVRRQFQNRVRRNKGTDESRICPFSADRFYPGPKKITSQITCQLSKGASKRPFFFCLALSYLAQFSSNRFESTSNAGIFFVSWRGLGRCFARDAKSRFFFASNNSIFCRFSRFSFSASCFSFPSMGPSASPLELIRTIDVPTPAISVREQKKVARETNNAAI